MPHNPIARVLVVDDDVRILKALKSALGRAGFDVVCAEEAAPAIALSDTSEFDIVIADYNMKASCGIDVVRHWKQLRGDLIFCAILSGEDGETTRDECVHAGADQVFCKPVSPIELRSQLQAAAEALRKAS